MAAILRSKAYGLEVLWVSGVQITLSNINDTEGSLRVM